MEKRRVRQPQDDKLASRIEKLEKAFKELTGVSMEEYNPNPDSDPVVETKEFDGSILKIHASGAKEFLRKCPYCGTPVADLGTHKSRCPKRPEF